MRMDQALDVLLEAAQPLTDGEAGDYDPLLELIGEARLVVLGAETLGTHELFRARAELTRRLVQDRGVTMIALAPDVRAAIAPIDRFARGHSQQTLAADALAGLTAFPRWLWRNAEMLDFLGWLRNFNDQFSGDEHKVGVTETDSVLELAAKTVVWTHSRDAGDARAADATTPTLGQRARERYRRNAFLVSFSTYRGSMVAAPRRGDERPRRVELRPAPAGSLEAMLHDLGLPSFCLPLRDASERLRLVLREPYFERMVDGIYDPEAAPDQPLRARVVDQFDALVHFDQTRSLEPMETS